MKKVWPTLYSRTNTGAIQVWWIEQEDEKYHSISGQIDGAKVIAVDTISEGKNLGKKNETTATDQAISEISSKYKKQLKSGDYWEDIKDIDGEKRFFQVMLAKSFDDYRDKIDWSKGVGIQIKYNGGRIVASSKGLFSRKGEKYISIPHIENSLQPFFQKFPDAILDGEGFNFELREQLNEIMKLLRKTVHVSQEDLERSKELVKYYIYDGFGFPKGKNQSNTSPTDGYIERKDAIDNAFFTPCFRDRYKNIIGEVPTWIVHSEKELQDLYNKFLEEKHEGAILRILDEPYENKRTKFLLKYKPEMDAEFRIVDVKDGDGGWANRIATVTCQRIDGGKYTDGTDSFDATFKGEREQAFEAWKTKDNLIGQVVTIHYNATTGYGKPNYARLDWNNYLNDK